MLRRKNKLPMPDPSAFSSANPLMTWHRVGVRTTTSINFLNFGADALTPIAELTKPESGTTGVSITNEVLIDSTWHYDKVFSVDPSRLGDVSRARALLRSVNCLAGYIFWADKDVQDPSVVESLKTQIGELRVAYAKLIILQEEMINDVNPLRTPESREDQAAETLKIVDRFRSTSAALWEEALEIDKVRLRLIQDRGEIMDIRSEQSALRRSDSVIMQEFEASNSIKRKALLSKNFEDTIEAMRIRE